MEDGASGTICSRHAKWKIPKFATVVTVTRASRSEYARLNTREDARLLLPHYSHSPSLAPVPVDHVRAIVTTVTGIASHMGLKPRADPSEIATALLKCAKRR